MTDENNAINRLDLSYERVEVQELRQNLYGLSANIERLINSMDMETAKAHAQEIHALGMSVGTISRQLDSIVEQSILRYHNNA